MMYYVWEDSGRMLAKAYRIDIRTPFQLILFPYICEANSWNIFIPATIEQTNNYPTLTLQKILLGSNLSYMNITDYQFIQLLNSAHLTPPQLEKLLLKLPNYCMANYDSSKECIQQSDEKYPFAMLTCLHKTFIPLGTEIILRIMRKLRPCFLVHLNNLQIRPK